MKRPRNVNIIPIGSLNDPRLSFYTSLTDVALRRSVEPDTGLYLAESTKVIERALAAGHRIVSVLTLAKWIPDLEPSLAGIEVDVFVGSEATLESLTGFHLHRGAIATMERPATRPVSEIIRDARVIVVLENIVDHTNVGAIFRSVAGLGADAVLVSPHCADPLYRRSVRVSMGTVLNVPWTRMPDWASGLVELREAGFTLAALALTDESTPLHEFVVEGHDRVALVFGSEGHGLSSHTLDLCDRVVRIPMSHSVDSLNVAASTAVTLYAVLNAGRDT